jgi:hypothetical protein
MFPKFPKTFPKASHVIWQVFLLSPTGRPKGKNSRLQNKTFVLWRTSRVYSLGHLFFQRSCSFGEVGWGFLPFFSLFSKGDRRTIYGGGSENFHFPFPKGFFLGDMRKERFDFFEGDGMG